jgi:FHA domain
VVPFSFVRTRRPIGIDDRLFEALSRLSADLGVEGEALIHQALLAFLRFHGVPIAEEPAAASTAVTAPGAEAGARETGGRTSRETVRRVLDTAHELERAMAPGAVRSLWLHGEHGPLARVEKDRFLIGRGRHCDLVIDSAKVSREHAVIRREPDGFWIEDLGSSNGTWLDEARIDRRRIEDGDVYLVCAEHIRCAFSPE